MTNLASIRQYLRLWAHDNQAPYILSDEQWNMLINRAYRRLAADWLFYKRRGGLVTDGVTRVFDLTEHFADYLSLDGVYLSREGGLIRQSADELQTSLDAGYLSTTPTFYSLQGTLLALNAAPRDTSEELITTQNDREFTSGIGNWTGSAGATLSVDSGRLKITANGTANLQLAKLTGVYQAVASQVYVLSFQIAKNISWETGVVVKAGADSTYISPGVLTNKLQTYNMTFTASDDDLGVYVEASSAPGNGAILYMDNFSIKAAGLVLRYSAMPEDMTSDEDSPVWPMSEDDAPITEAAKLEYARLQSEPERIMALVVPGLNALRASVMRRVMATDGAAASMLTRAHRI